MTDVELPPQKATAPRPLAELLHLAIPTVTQMASYTTMQFIDTWILSRLGETAATAASNSGMLAFAFISVGMGTLVLVNTLVSQSFGRGELDKCGQFLWQGIWLALAYGIALLPLRMAAGSIFGVFHHPPIQHAMEAEYFRISLLSAGVKLVSASIGQFFLGINRPNAVLAGAVFGVSVNAIAAWCIVLGHLGFASHGVAGAAWAQNIGVTCELLLLIALLTRRSVDSAYGASDMRIRPRLMSMLLRIGLPSGGQWFSDVLAWSLFCNGVMGLIGPAAMAANTFMLRYMVVSFLPVYGLSVAVTALVGRYIGRGEPAVARRRAHLGLAVAMTYVVLCGLAFVLARRPLIEVFSIDPQVDRIGRMLLILAAIYELSDALYIMYSGALRGAGDTLVPTLATAGMCWSLMLGGGFYVACRWPGWVTGPWTIACVYGWILGAWMTGRFVRGKWERIKLR
ncbi:MAG TPA: MATE family efflux transporter [Tepidisphaeraceae bacterium]|nr:MATE family efflux transporter [Tepidisphaeraceae bacterium]